MVGLFCGLSVHLSFNSHLKHAIHLLWDLIQLIAFSIWTNCSAMEMTKWHSKNTAEKTSCMSADYSYLALPVSQFPL